MYYILVCLSKVFQRTIFLFSSSRFSRKAFAKVRRFFVTSKFFQSFFEKIFEKFSEGVRLILSRSLAHPQGKILGAAIGTLFRSLSFTQSVIFSGSPSRKRLQRYRLFPFMQLLLHTFLQSFFRFLLNSLIYFMLYSIFFIVVRKRMWNDLHYIIRASACVCARKHRRIMTDGKHLIRPGRSARSLQKKTQGHLI